jgi:hypothetical protein
MIISYLAHKCDRYWNYLMCKKMAENYRDAFHSILCAHRMESMGVSAADAWYSAELVQNPHLALHK